jgi:hypothetical protein
MSTIKINTSKKAVNVAKQQFSAATKEQTIASASASIEFMISKGLIDVKNKVEIALGKNKTGQSMFRIYKDGVQFGQDCIVFTSGFYKGRGKAAMITETEKIAVSFE